MDDVDRLVPRRADLPERGCGLVAQGRAGPAGQQRRHRTRMRRLDRPDEVDAAVQAAEDCGSGEPRDRGRSEAAAVQVGRRDDAVLPRRERHQGREPAGHFPTIARRPAPVSESFR